MRLALELLVLFLLWLLCTTLGTCRPVTTEKLPFHTCGEHKCHPEPAHKSLPPGGCAVPSMWEEGGRDRTVLFLTMKAGITGCWNLVLKVCISCLVLAL